MERFDSERTTEEQTPDRMFCCYNLQTGLWRFLVLAHGEQACCSQRCPHLWNGLGGRREARHQADRGGSLRLPLKLPICHLDHPVGHLWSREGR